MEGFINSGLISVLVLFFWLWTLSLFETASPDTGKQMATRVTSFSAQATPEAQRRAFAVSIIISLADEARSYKDLALRGRVLARSADALWDVDVGLALVVGLA